APVIDISDEDFGLWYVDATGSPEKYEGKTVRFKGMAYKAPKLPKGEFVPGRFAMVCCDKDKQFLALVCKGEGLDRFKDRDWVKLRAAVKVEDCPAYEGPGPVLYVSKISACQKADPEVVSF
ncbi:MAG: hypothetical protein MRZ99_01460, partial [Clostridiales bacterium]|nr:hypothetical protein [Clostridiales bacterium]